MAILHKSKPIKALLGVEEYVSTDQIQVAEFLIPLGRPRHLYEEDVKSMSLRLHSLLERKFGRFFPNGHRPQYERNSKYKILKNTRLYLRELVRIPNKEKAYYSALDLRIRFSGSYDSYYKHNTIILAHKESLAKPTVEDIINHFKTL